MKKPIHLYNPYPCQVKKKFFLLPFSNTGDRKEKCVMVPEIPWTAAFALDRQ